MSTETNDENDDDEGGVGKKHCSSPSVIPL